MHVYLAHVIHLSFYYALKMESILYLGFKRNLIRVPWRVGSKEIIRRYKSNCPIFFQPVWHSDPKQLAEWILNDGLNVKVGLQIHKYIWGDNRRK